MTLTLEFEFAIASLQLATATAVAPSRASSNHHWRNSLELPRGRHGFGSLQIDLYATRKIIATSSNTSKIINASKIARKMSATSSILASHLISSSGLDSEPELHTSHGSQHSTGVSDDMHAPLDDQELDLGRARAALCVCDGRIASIF